MPLIRTVPALVVCLLVAGCDEGDPVPAAAEGSAEGGGELNVPPQEAVGEGEGEQGEGDGEGDGEVDCDLVRCAADEVCHPHSGRCVQCVGNADCSSERPTCLLLSGRCGCISSADCGALRRCDIATQACVAQMDGTRCVDDDDCPTGHCGPDSVCVFCTLDFHCDVQKGEVCNDEYQCDQPKLCGDGGAHCPEGGVCDAATGLCGPPACEDGAASCPECAEDDECGEGRFCDWASRICLDERRAALCEPCGGDGQCLRPNEPSGTCVERRAGGERLERFCGRECAEDRDCPAGYGCAAVGLGVSSCLPLRLDPAAADPGVTCAAVVDVGRGCDGDDECGVSAEGFCWQGACSYGCDDAGADGQGARPCVQGFVCAAVPAEIHPWAGACVRQEG